MHISQARHTLSASFATYWRDGVWPRWLVLRQMWDAGSAFILLGLGLNVALGLSSVGFISASSVLIERTSTTAAAGPGSHQWKVLGTSFLLCAGVFLLQQALAPMQSAIGQVIQHRVDGAYYDRVLTSGLRGPGIETLEDDSGLTRLHESVEEHAGGRTAGEAAAGMIALVARYTRLLGFVVVLGVVVSWWISLAVAAATLVFRHGHRSTLRVYMRVWPKVAPHRRERDYFRDIGLGARAEKELRLFGLTSWIAAGYQKSARAALMPLWRERRRVNVRRFLWFTVLGIVVACSTLSYVAWFAASDGMSFSKFVFGLQAMLAALFLGEFYHESDSPTQYGMIAARAMKEFEATMVEREAPQHLATSGAVPPADLGTLEFSNISFKYPHSGEMLINNLNLRLERGRCAALVGSNGAGKTTIVKLLLRLYRPTEGVITAGGRNIEEFDVDTWRRRVAVVFQDFNRYEFSVADNIALGMVEEDVDPDAVRLAARNAGIEEAIDSLPHGFDTLLAPGYQDGFDLSGGQWQRLALARALYAVGKGAEILILDEPTASLDVRGEVNFFRTLSGRAAGVTTLLISHRFTTIRNADHIMVLDGGCIVEQGTHNSLLSDSGMYATMFFKQAERYSNGEASSTGRRRNWLSDPRHEELE